MSKNGDLFNPTAGSVNNTSLSNTNPPGAALNDPRFGTQFPDRSSSDDRWLPFLFTAALLAGSVAGNFYMGWLWLATRRRFYSLVRERRIAS